MSEPEPRPSKLLNLFWAFVAASSPGVKPPDASQTKSGTLFFDWDDGILYLEIEIERDLQFDWFFKDRSTGESAFGSGSLQPLDELSALLEHINRFSQQVVKHE